MSTQLGQIGHTQCPICTFCPRELVSHGDKSDIPDKSGMLAVLARIVDKSDTDKSNIRVSDLCSSSLLHRTGDKSDITGHTRTVPQESGMLDISTHSGQTNGT